jgi:hypothetical protein
MSRPAHRFVPLGGSPLVVPVPEITAALLVLSLLAVTATFVVTRPIPAWSAFRGAGS